MKESKKVATSKYLCKQLNIKYEDLTDAQRFVLSQSAEYLNFINLLRSIDFVCARWRGVEITPKDLRR